MTRTGQQYLDSLDDGREIWVGAERIDNVVFDQRFSAMSHHFAHMYDKALADPELFYENAHDGLRDGSLRMLAYRAPASADALAAKRRMHAEWARMSFGFVGRSLDYIAAGMAGFAANLPVFVGESFDGRAAATSLYDRASNKSLFISFALTNIKADRTQPLSAQPKDHGSVLKVVKESDAGIYLTGMKGIATAAAFADEVIVGTIEPLAEGDRALAFTVVVNISTPGLRILSRQVYAGGVSHRDDAPLSSRYDENDAILSFKDVFVPWDRVLTYRDHRTTFGMWWETPAYL